MSVSSFLPTKTRSVASAGRHRTTYRGERLDHVREGVGPRARGERGRAAERELGIAHGRVRDEVGAGDAHLADPLGIGEDGHRRHLRPGACRGGQGDDRDHRALVRGARRSSRTAGRRGREPPRPPWRGRGSCLRPCPPRRPGRRRPRTRRTAATWCTGTSGSTSVNAVTRTPAASSSRTRSANSRVPPNRASVQTRARDPRAAVTVPRACRCPAPNRTCRGPRRTPSMLMGAPGCAR